jgi:hypothetical protein
MSENLEHFLKTAKRQSKYNPQICRLYTDCEDAHKIYSKLRFSCGKLFQNLEATAILTWPMLALNKP